MSTRNRQLARILMRKMGTITMSVQVRERLVFHCRLIIRVYALVAQLWRWLLSCGVGAQGVDATTGGTNLLRPPTPVRSLAYDRTMNPHVELVWSVVCFQRPRPTKSDAFLNCKRADTIVHTAYTNRALGNSSVVLTALGLRADVHRAPNIGKCSVHACWTNQIRLAADRWASRGDQRSVKTTKECRMITKPTQVLQNSLVGLYHEQRFMSGRVHQRTVPARRPFQSRGGQRARLQLSAVRPDHKETKGDLQRPEDRESVPPELASGGLGNWSSIAKLKLHTEDALFHDWKPNCRVHYLQNGTSGPPVLLIHGFGVGSFHFERNLEELGKEHRVWACDLFGQGASWPASPPQKTDKLLYSIDTWTEQLAAFIRDVIKDDGGAYVAGNSLGGLLAVTVAYRYPELVRGLILLNATPFWTVYSLRAFASLGLATVPVPPPAARFVRSTLFGYLSNPATISTFLRQVYVDKQAIDETLVRRMASAAGHPHAADAFLSMMLSPRGEQGLGKMAAAVAARGTPICLIHGEQDPWVRAWWARRLKRQVPAAEYFSISPAGHCPHHEVPHTINALMHQWILSKEEGTKPLMHEGELWQAGEGMELERVSAAGDGGSGDGAHPQGDRSAAAGGQQPVTVKLASGEPLNWLEGLTF
eukprot:jgi/Ulvmu1/3673/UM017_0087.1